MVASARFSGLTTSERQGPIALLTALAIVGLAMAAAGRSDPIGAHGFIIMLFAIGLIFYVISGYYTPEPDERSLATYYDDPTKVGIVLAMLWGVAGMGHASPQVRQQRSASSALTMMSH